MWVWLFEVKKVRGYERAWKTKPLFFQNRSVLAFFVTLVDHVEPLNNMSSGYVKLDKFHE